MIEGFARGTAVIEGPSFTNCTASFEGYISKVIEIYDDYSVIFSIYAVFGFSESFDLWPYLLINDKFIWLLYNVYVVS